MKKYFLLGACTMMAACSFGQQLQSSSFYEQQGVLHNPATAGTQKHGVVGVTYRTQWSNIAGSPKTATAFGSFMLPKQNFGLGAYAYNDQTGPTSRTGLNLSFAKMIPMEKGILSLGLSAQMQQFSIDVNKLSQSLGASDPVLAGGDNKFKFDAGFGVAYTSDYFQAGVAVAQLVQSKLDFYNGTSMSVSEQGRLYRHYYGHAMYKWNVDESTTIIPNVLFIYLPNAPLEFQGGARVEHNKLFWWGLSLRAKQSWMLSTGVHIGSKATIGYSFEIYQTPLSVYDKGSNAHEIMLRYDFVK